MHGAKKRLPNDAHIYAYRGIAQGMTWTIITNLSAQESIVNLDSTQLGALILYNQTINNGHIWSDFITTQIALAFAADIFVRKH